jgi:hypothetical protein
MYEVGSKRRRIEVSAMTIGSFMRKEGRAYTRRTRWSTLLDGGYNFMFKVDLRLYVYNEIGVDVSREVSLGIVWESVYAVG